MGRRQVVLPCSVRPTQPKARGITSSRLRRSQPLPRSAHRATLSSTRSRVATDSRLTPIVGPSSDATPETSHVALAPGILPPCSRRSRPRARFGCARSLDRRCARQSKDLWARARDTPRGLPVQDSSRPCRTDRSASHSLNVLALAAHFAGASREAVGKLSARVPAHRAALAALAGALARGACAGASREAVGKLSARVPAHRVLAALAGCRAGARHFRWRKSGSRGQGVGLCAGTRARLNSGSVRSARSERRARSSRWRAGAGRLRWRKSGGRWQAVGSCAGTHGSVGCTRWRAGAGRLRWRKSGGRGQAVGSCAGTCARWARGGLLGYSVQISPVAPLIVTTEPLFRTRSSPWAESRRIVRLPPLV